MNEIKLAILADVMLANNGYVSRHATIVNVRNKVKGATLSAVGEVLDDLVKWGHLSPLGKNGKGETFYCLPENYTAIREMMAEIVG